MLAILANTHLWCAAAGALVMKIVGHTAAWAGWGQAAKVASAADAAASIVKTALTPAPALPTTVAQMKAAAPAVVTQPTAGTPILTAPPPNPTPLGVQVSPPNSMSTVTAVEAKI